MYLCSCRRKHVFLLVGQVHQTPADEHVQNGSVLSKRVWQQGADPLRGSVDRIIAILGCARLFVEMQGMVLIWMSIPLEHTCMHMLARHICMCQKMGLWLSAGHPRRMGLLLALPDFRGAEDQVW